MLLCCVLVSLCCEWHCFLHSRIGPCASSGLISDSWGNSNEGLSVQLWGNSSEGLREQLWGNSNEGLSGQLWGNSSEGLSEQLWGKRGPVWTAMREARACVNCYEGTATRALVDCSEGTAGRARVYSSEGTAARKDSCSERTCAQINWILSSESMRERFVLMRRMNGCQFMHAYITWHT